MAINIPIITEFADQGLKSAQGAFDTFRSKVAEAEGGMGKFKAGAGVALDSVKANAGMFAAAAGGAIAGFALKAIGDFQDLALNVDEFRNKTNLTLDQSSRWASYAGDLGIESDAMIKVFDKLGKAATDQIPAFEELGVEIAFGPDGATDIEETFFRVTTALNKIEDPAKRAKLQAELFGKGWMDASEIINSSVEDMKTSLAGVGDFELIDEEEIEKAKDLRAAQDRLGDALANISVTIGEALIPALTLATETLAPLIELLGDLNLEVATDANKPGGMIKEYVKAWDSLNDPIKFLTGSAGFELLSWFIDDTSDTAKNQAQIVDQDMVNAWKNGYGAMIDAKNASSDLTDALIDVDDALADLKGNVDERQAWRNLQDELDRVKDAAIKAFTEATPAALRDSEAALDRARLKVGEYIGEIDSIPEDQKTEFIAMLDTASVQQIEAILAHLARAREVPFMPSVTPGQGGISEIGSGGRPIGEAPINLSRRNVAGAGSIIVNVGGSVIAENDLIETVRKGLVNAQRNGAGLVYTNR